jgi:hypothetical protein
VSQFTPLLDVEQTAALPAPRIAGRFRDATALAAFAGILGAVALRVALVFRYRIDSDETQHLHVVWAWTHGLLQYRDLFDNHMPLFHILSVPLLRLAGERPETPLLMRMAMLPLFAAMALLTYRIGASCNPRRAAIWAMVIGCLAPDFFLCSIEFRTDILWATSWLAAVALLVRCPLTPGRAAAAGLALGVAGATSAKTSLLAASLAVAAIATLVLTREHRIPGREIAKSALSFAAAAFMPVVAVAFYFFARGAWSSFVYCTVTHNIVASDHPVRLLLLPLSIAIMIPVTRRIMRDEIPIEVLRRRLFLFLSASVYGAALISLWPIVETEHWLPFYPVAAAAIVPLLLPVRRVGPPRLVLAILALELFWIVRVSTPWRNRAIPSMVLIEQAMTLTAPTESVIDLKGEIVFRRRAFYYVLEKLTKKAISKGRLQDTIAADVLRTRTMVSVPDNLSFPRDGRAFLLRNFVRVGCLRVAGMMVTGSSPFRIEIPGQYAVLSEHGDFPGALDGTPYAGPRFLAAGVHTVTNTGSSRAAVIWQRAAVLGFSPFVTDRRCVDDGLASRSSAPPS